MNLETARFYAAEVVNLLGHACVRIEIGGSIRRCKSDNIHDIEIICQPKFGSVIPLNPDGSEIPPEQYDGPDPLVKLHAHDNVLDRAVDQLLFVGIFSHDDPVTQHRNGKEFKVRAPFSEKYKRVKFRGEQVDLFVVTPPAQFPVVFLIRTGDAEFSRAFVLRLWNYGLRSINGHIERAGQTLDTPTEEDVFRLCHLPFIEPEKRTLETIKQFPV